MFMLMEDDFFIFIIYWFLLFFNCFSHVVPCLIMSSHCCPLSSPGFLLFDYATPLPMPLMVAYSLVAWWWRGFTCYFLLIMSFQLSSHWLILLSPVISCYLLLSPVIPCYPLFDYVFLLILQVFLLDLIFLSCPHGFLRGILMRIATILWSVWFDDCLRLSVKLSFSVPLLPVLSLCFLFVLFISLFTAMMILCLFVSLMLIRNNVLSEVSSVYYLCPLDLRMLSRDVFVFISTCPCHFSGMLL